MRVLLATSFHIAQTCFTCCSATLSSFPISGPFRCPINSRKGLTTMYKNKICIFSRNKQVPKYFNKSSNKANTYSRETSLASGGGGLGFWLISCSLVRSRLGVATVAGVSLDTLPLCFFLGGSLSVEEEEEEEVEGDDGGFLHFLFFFLRNKK